MKKVLPILAAIMLCGLTLKAQVNLKDGLVAYYPFNGNANDESGNGYNGINYYAQLTSDRFGNNSKAYLFNGIDSYIDIPNFTDLTSFSVSFWVKDFNINDNGQVFSNGGWATYDGSIDISVQKSIYGSNRFTVVHQTGSNQSVFVSNQVIDDSWNNLIIAYDDNTKTEKMFVNGVLISSFYNTYCCGWSGSPLTPNQNPIYTYKIGCSGGGIPPLPYFYGVIDDIHVFNRAINEHEVQALFTEPEEQPINLEKGLVAYYPFNGNANDESGNGNNGILNGPTLTTDRFGNANNAYQFTDDKVHPSFIKVLASPSTNLGNELTVSVWYKVTSSIDQRPIIDYTGLGMHLWSFVNHPEWGSRGTGANLCDLNYTHHIISIENPPVNSWHHLVVTYDGSTGISKLYSDGVKKEEINLGIFTPLNNTDLCIGARDFDVSYQFNGYLDDIRLYNRPLSEEEVQALYVPAPTGNITYQVWNNIGRSTRVSSLTTNLNYPNNPTYTSLITAMEAPINQADNYGARIAGYLCAPATGEYTFWIASNNEGELWLSTDNQPANKLKIAYHTDFTNPREWNKFPSQKSVSITLTKGKSYYIEALMKESNNNDNFAVGWLKPGQTGLVPSEVIPGSVLSPILIIPPSTNSPWTVKAPMPTDRLRLVAATVNKRIYAIGGTNGDTQFSCAVEEYDPITNSWTRKANMLHGRSELGIAVVRDTIYCIGGYEDAVGLYVGLNEAYIPSTDTWISRKPLPIANDGFMCTVVNDRIYAIGGLYGWVFEYNPASDTWVTKSPMPIMTGWGVNVTINNKIYAIGGNASSQATNAVQVYDPLNDTWERLPDMPASILCMAGAVIDNKAYLFGGSTDWWNPALNSVWEFNSSDNTWKAQTPMNETRTTCAAAVVNNQIYVMGGVVHNYGVRWGSTNLNTMFDPNGNHQDVCYATGNITYQVWNNIGSSTKVKSLTSNINYPNNPTASTFITSMEAPINQAENFGAKIAGYICAPATGYYTFWIASNNEGELWFSSDDQTVNKRKIAYHTNFTSSREWNKFPTQKSAAIYLIQGKSYYIEALMKEYNNNDNLAVGWLKPGQTGGVPSEIIPGSVLSPLEVNSKIAEAKPETNGLSELDVTLSVFPNPLYKDKLNINLENLSSDATLRIFTISGVQCYEASVQNSGTIQVDRSEFKNGIYIIKIENEDFVETTKLIVY